MTTASSPTLPVSNRHSVQDSYWGDGGDGSGKNMLGLILMEVRGVLRADPGT